MNKIHKIKNILIALMFCMTISVFIAPFINAKNSQGEYISIINLIANPEKYHNNKVMVEGYLIIAFEGNALYLSEDAASNAMTKNALWLSIDEFFENLQDEEIKEYLTLNKSYVMIKGVFDSADKGHGSMYSGAINKIEQIRPTFKRFEKRNK